VGVLIKTLHQTVGILKEQLKRIDFVIPKLEEHERELFNKCVEALEQSDELWKARAILYANECAEVRKLLKTTIACKFALEQALLRLETVEDTSDLVVEGVTVAQVLSVLRKRLGAIIPEVSYYLGLAEKTLSKMVTEVRESLGLKLPFESKEAEKLLKQAEEQAEEEMKSKPEIP
jgi:division protein CdvB (Snf7/Vps24/ESCRT-III family)